MKKLLRMLKRPGIIFVAVAVALALVTVSFFSFRRQVDGYTAEEMRAQIDAIQENSTLLLQNELNYLKKSTASVANMLRSADIQTDADILRALSEYAEAAKIEHTYFITIDGHVYTSYRGYLGLHEESKLVNDLPLSAIKEPIFSQPVYYEALDEVIFSVIAPTSMGDKQGVLISSYNINDLYTLLTGKFISGSADVGIVDSEGAVVVGKNTDEFGYNIFDGLCPIEFEVSSCEEMQANLARGKSGLSVYSVGGDAHYCSYAPLGLNGWYMMVMVKESVLHSKLTDLERYGFQLTVKLVLIMAGLLFVIIVSWLGEQKRIRIILERAAQLDGLTGIQNRKSIEETIESSLSAAGQDCRAALLVIDLDDFKRINDQRGHLFGDYVLRECAVQLTRIFGEEGAVGRIGGDEFVVFLRDGQDMRRIEEQVRGLMDHFYVLTDAGEQQKISVSVGIARADPSARSFLLLYQMADAALYRAKQAGKARLSE